MPLLSYYHHSDPDLWAAYPQAEAIRTAGVLLRTRRAAVGGLEKTILSLLVIIIISLSVTVYGLGVETESGSTASKHKANRFTYTSMCIYTHTHVGDRGSLWLVCIFCFVSIFVHVSFSQLKEASPSLFKKLWKTNHRKRSAHLNNTGRKVFLFLSVTTVLSNTEARCFSM